MTYRSIFGGLCTATLDGHQMSLMLETLWSDETLDARSFGVWFLALVLRLNLAANNETADLPKIQSVTSLKISSITASPTGEGMSKSHRGTTHIIFLTQVKKPPDLCCPLGPQSLRMLRIRQPWNVCIALLHNSQRQYTQIHSHNAPPHALPLALPGSPGPIAAVALTQQ